MKRRRSWFVILTIEKPGVHGAKICATWTGTFHDFAGNEADLYNASMAHAKAESDHDLDRANTIFYRAAPL